MIKCILELDWIELECIYVCISVGRLRLFDYLALFSLSLSLPLLVSFSLSLSHSFSSFSIYINYVYAIDIRNDCLFYLDVQFNIERFNIYFFVYIFVLFLFEKEEENVVFFIMFVRNAGVWDMYMQQSFNQISSFFSSYFSVSGFLYQCGITIGLKSRVFFFCRI